MSVMASDFLLSLLAKGLVWMSLCGLAALTLRGCGRAGGDIWRTALAFLAFLSGICLLPAAWTWSLPELPMGAADAGGAEFSSSPIEWGNVPPGQGPPSSTVTMRQSVSTMAGWQWDQLLFLLWAGGAGGLGVWLAAGFFAVRRWILQGVPLTGTGWRETLEKECRAMSIKRPPLLLCSPSVPGPCAAGWLRPVILLPVHGRDWDGEMRRIVLRHELSHIRGGDPRQAWVRVVALMIHWMNPLVWLASSRSRRAEELKADASVLAGEAVTPERYAAVLLTVARSCQISSSSSSFHHPLLTAMAHPSTLEHRLRHILTKTLRPAGPARFASMGVCVSLVGAVFIGCSSVEREGRGETIILPGAETPQVSIKEGDLKNLIGAEPSTALKFRLTYRVTDTKGQLLRETFLQGGGSEPMTLAGQTTLKKGQEGKVEHMHEFPAPTGFDSPYKPGEISFSMVSTIPWWGHELKFSNVGWSMDELKVRPQGASLVVSGVFRETVCDGFIRNTGEAFSPVVTDDGKVVLTDNKVLSPAFSSRETQFLTATLPGKTYRTRLNLRQPGAFLEITCDPLEK